MTGVNSLKTLQAVILCGGLGTRLRSVVSDRPKCLAQVGGRPFLELLLDWLSSFEIREITLCLGHGSEMVIEFLEKRNAKDTTFSFAVEKEPLGTGGALKNAEYLVHRDPFVVMNGDSILDFRLDRLVKSHQEHQGLATLALAQGGEPGRYGNVTMDDSGRITGFYEKGEGCSQFHDDRSRAFMFSGGVYAFSGEIFTRIPHAPPPVSLERDVFPRLVNHGLYGVPSHGYFLDIGVPSDYARAQVELPQRFPIC